MLHHKNHDIVTAAFNGNENTVKTLIASNQDIEVTDEFEFTALRWAAFKGYVSIVNLLLAKKADVNAADSEGETAIIKACVGSTGSTHTMITTLLKSGADLSLKNRNGVKISTLCEQKAASFNTKQLINNYLIELHQVKMVYLFLIKENNFPKEISTLVTEYLDNFCFFNKKNKPNKILNAELMQAESVAVQENAIKPHTQAVTKK